MLFHNREIRQSWYDVMQVCENGHKITSQIKTHPEESKDFCPRCGNKTISECLQCHTEIHGYKHIERMSYIDQTTPPQRCHKCGAMFPWSAPPNLKEFKQLLEDFYQFINDKNLVSVCRLMLNIIQSQPHLQHIHYPSNELTVVNNFYWGIQTLFEKDQINTNKLDIYIEQFNSLLLSFNLIVKEFVELFQYTDSPSKDKVQNYSTLSLKYNAYISRYEQFIKQTGKTLDIDLEVLPPLSDIPKKLIPPEISQRTYASGEAYELYKDLKLLIKSACKEVFIIEPYVSEEIFGDYLDQIPSRSTIPIRLLIDKTKGNFQSIAKKFSKSRTIKIKKSTKIHDRVFFFDDKCYVLGQSSDVAATSKPTYLIEFNDVGMMRKSYQSLWDSASKIL